MSTMATSLKGQTKIGLKLGYNLTKPDIGKNDADQLDFDEYKEFKAFHLGVLSNFKLIKKFDINLDLFYVGKGFNSQSSNSNSILNNIIALSPSLRYEVVPKLRIMVGGELNYLLNIYTVDGLSFENVTKRIPEDLFPKRFKAGYVLGLQYQFLSTWELDFRYVRIFEEGNSDFMSRTYTRTFMLSINKYFRKKAPKESTLKLNSSY